MATIKISRAKSCTAALNYARGQNQLKEPDKAWLVNQGVNPELVASLHNRAVVTSGLNIDPAYASSQMKQTRDLFQNTGSTQAMRVIQSFNEHDLNAANPADWDKANQLGQELAQKMAPDHQVAVYTHLDGTGHKLHNHIIVNMPSLTTGKKYHHQNDFKRLAKFNDEIAMAHGLSIISNNLNRRLYPHKIAPEPPEKRTIAERNIARKGGYVWKDDLRAHIDKVMLDTSVDSYKTFSEHLAKSGIITHERGKSLSFEFLDAENKHRRARGKSLGTDYEKEQIFHELERRSQQPNQSVTNSRASSPSRAFEQRKQQAEQRERIAKSREPAITQSGQSIDRLTVATGRDTRYISSTAKEFSPHVQRTKHQTRDLGTRIKRFGGQISNFSNAISAIAGKIGRYLNQLQAQKQQEQALFNQLQDKLDQSRQNKEDRDDNGYYHTYQNRGFHR